MLPGASHAWRRGGICIVVAGVVVVIVVVFVRTCAVVVFSIVGGVLYNERNSVLVHSVRAISRLQILMVSANTSSSKVRQQLHPTAYARWHTPWMSFSLS